MSSVGTVADCKQDRINEALRHLVALREIDERTASNLRDNPDDWYLRFDDDCATAEQFLGVTRVENAIRLGLCMAEREQRDRDEDVTKFKLKPQTTKERQLRSRARTVSRNPEAAQAYIDEVVGKGKVPTASGAAAYVKRIEKAAKAAKVPDDKAARARKAVMQAAALRKSLGDVLKHKDLLNLKGLLALYSALGKAMVEVEPRIKQEQMGLRIARIAQTIWWVATAEGSAKAQQQREAAGGSVWERAQREGRILGGTWERAKREGHILTFAEEERLESLLRAVEPAPSVEREA